jgi:predicted RNA-binding Zn-ribbon protein involved in translation (DUF1610 family)
MPLFSITCTTCKSRLSVRDAGAIGQILACPKCGGMVMVRPPANWQEAAEGGSPAASSPQSAAASPQPTAPPSAAPKTAATPPTTHRPTAKQSPPADDQTATDIPPPGSARRDAQATLSDSHFDAVDDLLSSAPPRVPQSAIPPAHAHQAHASPAHAANPPAADPANVHRNRFSGGALPAPTKAAAAEPAPPPVGHPSSQADAGAGAGSDEPVDFEEAIAASRVRPRNYWPVYIGASAAGTALALAVVVAASNYFADRAPSGPIAKAGNGNPATTPTHPLTRTTQAQAQPTPANPPRPRPLRPPIRRKIPPAIPPTRTPLLQSSPQVRPAILRPPTRPPPIPQPIQPPQLPRRRAPSRRSIGCSKTIPIRSPGRPIRRRRLLRAMRPRPIRTKRPARRSPVRPSERSTSRLAWPIRSR